MNDSKQNVNFIFKNRACKIKVESSFFTNDIYFRVYGEEEKYNFGFFNGSAGLVRYKDDKKTSSTKYNLLGRFLALDNTTKDNGIQKIRDFFDDFGFLFIIPKGHEDSIAYNDILDLVRRISCTVQLYNQLKSGTDHEQILIALLRLIYAPNVNIETDYSIYRSYIHAIKSALGLYKRSEDFGSWNIINDEENSDDHRDKFYSISPVIRKKSEEENNFEQDQKNILEHNLEEDNSFFAEIDSNEELKRPGLDDQSLKRISEAYKHSKDYDEVTFRSLRFLFRYYRDVGIIKGISTDNKLKYYSDPCLENFTDEKKNELIWIAKQILVDEINYNLSGIRVIYDPDDHKHDIRIDTLLEALYYSLANYEQNNTILKQCPTCHEFFETTITKTNKKYCSKICQNRRPGKNKLPDELK